MKTDHNQDQLGAFSTLAEQNIRPVVRKYDQVGVTIDLSNVTLDTYSRALFSELEMASSLRGGVFPVELEELQAYIRTLVKVRVDYVNRERPLFGPRERIAVPSYLHCLLSNVGLAVDVDKGVELHPMIGESEGAFLGMEDVLRISRILRTLGAIGFEYAEGYSRDRTGSWEFMAMCIVDDVVLRHDKEAHPVYALLASTLAIRGVETVLSPRVEYAGTGYLQSIIQQLAQVRSA